MLQIDLYTEISCPWCLIGQYRLDKVLRERFPTLVPDIRHHPVLLLSHVPTTGLYIPDLLKTRYGVTDPKSSFARVESEALKSGLALDLSRQLYTYPTQAAHALIMAAREKNTQHKLAVAITEAYFIGAKNIADVNILADISLSYRFERDEVISIATDPTWHARVEQEAENSMLQGVRSVPHFVFAEQFEINGGRSEDEIAFAIERALLKKPDIR
ncbi:DsbA family oxidoreductase [Acinetobacter seifertii]|uniref:DsbA family oxidoreductase n=1 Tax=Acinetobacter seifertii TaxID=1530123 RepID=UPI000D355E50|nr:DsbA family protein [Acinetobacter seifertii]PTV58466.1 polyketide synthase [Acinetobacter seifertii]